jgi:hypothetical protein
MPRDGNLGNLEHKMTVKGNAMKAAFNNLHDYELEGILEALRRDVRHETQAAIGATTEDAQFHRFNVHISTRLLEQLNPKTPCEAYKYEPHESMHTMPGTAEPFQPGTDQIQSHKTAS